jgi:hypothetical protein
VLYYDLNSANNGAYGHRFEFVMTAGGVKIQI